MPSHQTTEGSYLKAIYYDDSAKYEAYFEGSRDLLVANPGLAGTATPTVMAGHGAKLGLLWGINIFDRARAPSSLFYKDGNGSIGVPTLTEIKGIAERIDPSQRLAIFKDWAEMRTEKQKSTSKNAVRKPTDADLRKWKKKHRGFPEGTIQSFHKLSAYEEEDEGGASEAAQDATTTEKKRGRGHKPTDSIDSTEEASAGAAAKNWKEGFWKMAPSYLRKQASTCGTGEVPQPEPSRGTSEDSEESEFRGFDD